LTGRPSIQSTDERNLFYGLDNIVNLRQSSHDPGKTGTFCLSDAGAKTCYASGMIESRAYLMGGRCPDHDKLVFHVSITDKKVPALIMKICNVISRAPE
jgi:hypothetical protein